MKGQLKMAGFEETFKGLLLEFLNRREIDAVEVTSYEEYSYTESYGGCETCGWDEKIFEVDIYYRRPDQTYASYSNYYTYKGKFSDLLRELVEIGKELDAR